MRSLFCLAALLAGCATPMAPPAVCPAERAIYTLRGEPGAQLRLIETPHPLNAYSDLAARVDFDGESFWFAFVSSLGFSRDYLSATADPFAAAARETSDEEDTHATSDDPTDSSELIAFDAAYNVVSGSPQAGQPAPAHLHATAIASSLWYSNPRRVLPKALWDLTGCADAQR